MFHIAVAFDVPPQRRDHFIAAALEDGRNCAVHEPSTLRFELIADHENPNRFYLDEAYEDEAAFDAHAKGEHFARFFELIQEYADGPTFLIRGTTVAQD
ncbi:MAG TPA: putative quinol monooxygenase [Mycobacteriales bacterium]|nr:putative quinol monooxygenase [Mycobacteriales bacterium]